MKKLFIGIDISKDVFDFLGISEDGEVVIVNGVANNDTAGIRHFIKSRKRHDSYELHICMEHTGHYGFLLTTEFTLACIKFSLINPLEIKHSIGLVRGKTDAIDAYRIAKYALTHKYDLKPYVLPIKEIQHLKALISLREGYVKIMVQLKNTLKAFEIIATSIPLKKQLKQHQKLIAVQEKAIDSIEQQMKEIIENNENLSSSFKKITSVIGVGPLTGIKCIIETENFTRFNNARKFACHCGLAPFEYQSGSSVRKRTKTSPIRDKSLKSILFKAASSAIQHDPQLKNYYKRKIEAGKHKLSVLNAIANKIVLRIFAVAKRNEPFLKLAA